jgi:hypothetical protein
MRDTEANVTRIVVTDRVGVILSEIDAGVMRIASTVSVGVAIRLRFANAPTKRLTVNVGEAIRLRPTPVRGMTIALTERLGATSRVIAAGVVT